MWFLMGNQSQITRHHEEKKEIVLEDLMIVG